MLAICGASSTARQFPEDDSLSDGPKRLRAISSDQPSEWKAYVPGQDYLPFQVTMRDAHGKLFETDVVVSDASTDLRSLNIWSLGPLQYESCAAVQDWESFQADGVGFSDVRMRCLA